MSNLHVKRCEECGALTKTKGPRKHPVVCAACQAQNDGHTEKIEPTTTKIKLTGCPLCGGHVTLHQAAGLIFSADVLLHCPSCDAAWEAGKEGWTRILEAAA